MNNKIDYYSLIILTILIILIIIFVSWFMLKTFYDISVNLNSSIINSTI